MATASPSPLLAAFDRPVAERLEAKGPEAAAGEFAGLMGQLVNAIEPAQPTQASVSAKPVRTKGPQAPLESSQAEPQAVLPELPEGCPLPVPAPPAPAVTPAGSAPLPAAPPVVAPPGAEQAAPGLVAPALPPSTVSAAPLPAATLPPEPETEAPAPLLLQSAPLLPMDLGTGVVPVPASVPAVPQEVEGTAPKGPLPAISAAPQGAPTPSLLAPPPHSATPFPRPEPSAPQALRAEVLQVPATAPTAPESPQSAVPSEAPATPVVAPSALPTASPQPEAASLASRIPGTLTEPLQQLAQPASLAKPDAAAAHAPKVVLLTTTAPATFGPQSRIEAEASQVPGLRALAPATQAQAPAVTVGSQPVPTTPSAAEAATAQPLGSTADGPVLSTRGPVTLLSAAEVQALRAASAVNAPTRTALLAEARPVHLLGSLPATLLAASTAPVVTTAGPGPLPQAQPTPTPAVPTTFPAPSAGEGNAAPAVALPMAPAALPLPLSALSLPPTQEWQPAPVLPTPQAGVAEPITQIKAAILAEPLLQAADAPAGDAPTTGLKPGGGINLHGAAREPIPAPGQAPLPSAPVAQDSPLNTQPGTPLQGAPTPPEAPEQKSAKTGSTPSAHVQDGTPLAALSAQHRVAEAAVPVAQTTPPPAPPPSAPALQVEGGLKWMLKGGAQEAQLQLHPDSLGQVTIHLKVQGGEVHVRLWVTDPTSMQAVRDGQEHLGVALREQGLQLGSFDLQQGHRPHQEAPPAPVVREHLLPERPSTRQEAPTPTRPASLNPHHVELYA